MNTKLLNLQSEEKSKINLISGPTITKHQRSDYLQV